MTSHVEAKKVKLIETENTMGVARGCVVVENGETRTKGYKLPVIKLINSGDLR